MAAYVFRGVGAAPVSRNWEELFIKWVGCSGNQAS